MKGNLAAIPSRGFGSEEQRSAIASLCGAASIQSRWVGGGEVTLHGTQTQLLRQSTKTPSRPPWPRVLPYSSSLHNPTPPCPFPPLPLLPSRTYGDHLEVWRGEVSGCFIITKCRCQGGLACWTTCSPGSLWRGMFNSLIPHPSLLLLLLFLHNLTLNLGFTLGNENYFGFKIMRMRA